MITTAFSNSPQNSISATVLLRRGWQINRPLVTFILICFSLTAIGIIGMVVDPRTLNGQSVWMKPVKFGISNALYCATILLLLSTIQPRPCWVNWLFNITSATLLTGMMVVLIQAARGVKSHYNFATPFDSIVLSIMGLSTLTVSIVSLIACILLVRQPIARDGSGISRSLAWSVKLGVLITVLVGFGVGSLMLLPSETQMADMQAGRAGAGSIIGAHTVGAEDGGPGLPILGWSTTDGDLRPAHFFGLHALQVLPLLGLFVTRRRESWLAEGHRVSLVAIAGLSYAGFIGLITWQALRAESIVAPSAETLTAFAALIAASGLAVAATLFHANRSAK